jgi:two-component system chemotaxis response regulator CheB
MHFSNLKTIRELKKNHELIVIGASWGGLEALTNLLSPLPSDYSLPILVVQHRCRNPMGREFLTDVLNQRCQLNATEPEDKQIIEAGNIYLAPSNYHMLVERKGVLALSTDEPEHYSRPAIDLLFESAAVSYRNSVIGIILTGANHDGAKGLQAVKNHGGCALVQAPETAEVNIMPLAAITATQPDAILPLDDMTSLLLGL